MRMRKNVYSIYKALRHFGVSAKEVSEIAKNYPTWLNCPIEEKSPYNWVYYLNGYLVSMPFPIDALNEKGKLIGYGVGDTVFGAIVSEKVKKENVEFCLQEIKNDLKQTMVGVADDNIPEIEFRLPTAADAEKVFSCFAKNWLKNCIATMEEAAAELPEMELPEGTEIHLEYSGVNQIPDMWITPDPDAPEKTAVRLGFNRKGAPYCRKYVPGKRIKPSVCAIANLRKGTDFIGKVGRYGIPTPATLRMYYQLLDSLY